MNWIGYAIVAIFSISIFDFLLKLSIGKIHNSLAGFLANLVGAFVIFLFLIFSFSQNEKVFTTKPGGILIAVLAGIAVGLANIFFLKLYGTGVNFSIAQPFVRVGVVIVGSLIGAILLKEGASIKYLIGFSLSLIGLYLIFTTR